MSEQQVAILKQYEAQVRGLSRLLVDQATILATEPHPESQLRHAVLIHSALRVARSGEAQVSLSVDLYAEEIQCLNRTLAEMCINAAYLQFASVAELDSYLRYDSAALAGTILRMSSEMPKSFRFSAVEESKVRKLASQKPGGAFHGWSAKTPILRARAVDKHCSADALMTPIALFVYEGTHTHVHGTASSVAKVGDWLLQGGDKSDTSRIEATTSALNAAAVCLLSLCIFIDGRYQLGSKAKIEDLKVNLSKLGLID